MGTNRKTTPRRGTTLGDSDADKWLRGDECGFFIFIGEDYLRKLWSDNRDDIVAEHIETAPGTRPQRWWEYDAKEPRRRISGTGTPASDVLNIVPSFQFGLPLVWIDQSDCDYYTRGGELTVNRVSNTIVTSDTVDLASYPKSVTVLTAGNVVCLPLKNTDNAGGLVTLVSLVAGYTLPFRVRRINATGTTATLTA